MTRYANSKVERSVMPNFTKLLFASLLLISTGTRSGWSATLPSIWSSTSSSSSPPPAEGFKSLGYQDNSIEPPSKICHSNSDCPPTSCCTVGMMRYSQPTCMTMGDLGDPCIPGNSVQNFTLSYPKRGGGGVGDEEEVTVIDSFRLLCPCSPELQCDEKTVSCMGA